MGFNVHQGSTVAACTGIYIKCSCVTFPVLLKVVILGLKQKLVWSSLKALKKKRLSGYVWKSLDPLWSWAVMTQTWSEPFFYIPSFSSTCQSFTELIFYHRCHNQPVYFLPETSQWHSPSSWLRLGENTDVFFTFPAPPQMLVGLSSPSALACGLIPCLLSGLDVIRQSWMAGVIRLEGRACLLFLPLLPSSHPKTDSRADASEGIKLMWWRSHLPGAPTG